MSSERRRSHSSGDRLRLHVLCLRRERLRTGHAPARADYNALNQPKKHVLGGGGTTAEIRHTFNGLDTRAPASPFAGTWKIEFQKVGVSDLLVNHTLAYDPRGNVTSLTQLTGAAQATETTSFTYDDLDRLTQASGAVSETYGYNAIGNLTSRNGNAYTYPASGAGSVRPHAVTAYNGAGFGYDANGCMTLRGGSWNQTIKYDPERRPVRVHGGGATTARFAYGWDGERLKRLDAAGTVHYPFPFYERNVGNGTTLLTESVTRLYHAHLGTLRRQLVRRAKVVWIRGDTGCGKPGHGGASDGEVLRAALGRPGVRVLARRGNRLVAERFLY